MKKLFGTDGVRGVANVYPMTTEMAMQLGRAAAYIFKSSSKHRHRIVIGKDTRLSGYMLENALVAGICSMGVDVLLVGPLPTPGIANITSSMRADAGVVISASHNPFQDNGIKFFSADGFKLPDQIELKIEKLIETNHIDSLRPTANEVGKAFRIDDATGRYIVFLKNTFPQEMDLSGLKIVLDCANGAAYKVAPAVFRELGAEVITLGVSPDGTNINAGCGSLYPAVISEAVKEHRADIGIALDGDADRVIVCDEFGNEVDGDHIMAICATDMIKRKLLKKKTLVTTVMSNMGLDIAIRNAGGKIVKTAVGDRYVVEEMRKGGYNLGGEQSGHMIFLDYNTTGDGILSALQLLAVMRRENKALSELSEVMIALPQVLVNTRVREKVDILTLPDVAAKVRDVEDKLGNEGRVLIRYSGTEPLLRVMLEGKDTYEITGWANEIIELVKKHIGEK
ncbi:MAG TPA: phosphoglucosamine mutase [Deltaproteobacteria bacterium]|mgnify:CR=1 FL=1|nr:phosphoglucosamine mutase [Deltaproteobacteria bacterium]HQB38456.1 phosphoglucosamine mutase [Deltaproteobacteria bacterium]